MQDFLPIALGVLGTLLSLVFLWRGYSYLTDAPSCARLAEVDGPARDVSIERRFYSARWLEFSVDDQRLYVPASPFVLPAVHPLRFGARSTARFCPGEGSRPRVWELSVDGTPILGRADWRRFAVAQARVMAAGAILFLLLAGLAFRLARRVV